MSIENNHIEDWEKDLRDGLASESVPTTDQDFEQFMGQLEDSGYFEKDNKRRYFWWFLGAVGLGLALYFLSPSTTSTIQNKNTVPEKIVVETEAAKTSSEKSQIEASQDLPLGLSEDEPEDKEEIKAETVTNSTAKPKREEKLEPAKATVIPEAVVDSSLFVDPEEKVIEYEETKAEEASEVKAEDKPQVETKKKPTVIIMTTDTTVIRDTSHVKEKRNKKRKK